MMSSRVWFDVAIGRATCRSTFQWYWHRCQNEHLKCVKMYRDKRTFILVCLFCRRGNQVEQFFTEKITNANSSWILFSLVFKNMCLVAEISNFENVLEKQRLEVYSAHVNLGKSLTIDNFEWAFLSWYYRDVH